MDMTMTSSSSKASSNSTAATSADHHQMQQVMGMAEQARNVKLVAAGQLDEALRCPRCDSINTKFSYYNNHNMSQPRYFCKACRRYWTQGGSLRNVPVGGGCHKKKRSNSSSIINQHHLEPQDFPNVLPTFVSTSFEPMSFSSLTPAPRLPSTFVNLLRSGGIVDDQGNHFNESTSSSMCECAKHC